MASEISAFSLPLTKTSIDDQHQQQQWLLSTTKKTSKQTNHLRYRILLDNYFSPLSNSSNSFVSTISTSFPSIMPTLIPKAATPKQRSINTFFDKKSHSRVSNRSDKSDSSVGSQKSSMSKSNSQSPSVSPKKSTSPTKSIISNTSKMDIEPKSINLTGKEKSDSGDEQDEICTQGTSKGDRKLRKSIELSLADEDSDDSDIEGNTSKQSEAINKDGWDSDSSDSDKMVTDAIDRATAKVYGGKNDWEDESESEMDITPSIPSKSVRTRRHNVRGNRPGKNSMYGRGNKGRVGNLDRRLPNPAEATSSDDEEWISSKSATKKTDPPEENESTSRNGTLGRVENGVKRRKSIATATINDIEMKTLEPQDEDGDEDDDEDILPAKKTDISIGDELDDTSDDADAKKDDDADSIMQAPDEDDDAPDDEEAVVTEVLPFFDTKWLFEFQPKSQVSQFKIDSIIGCLATAIRAVDPTAYIVTWNNANADRIWSSEMVPKSDEAISNFVEDPHISSVGQYGRLYGRIRLRTSLTLSAIKQNPEFGTWIRNEGLFLDISEIPSTRPKMLGFFDRQLPHASRIDIFDGYLKETLNISKPYQIYSQTINAGDNSGLKCYVYVLKADYQDAEIILDEIAQSQKKCSSKFYVWEDFRDHTELVDKRKFITDMTLYARNHASFVFNGIATNDYMRLKNNKRSQKDANSDKNMSSLQREALAEATSQDNLFSHLRCLDYMQQVFVDSDNNRIFKKIHGPYNNNIEVVFEKAYFKKVRDIEKQFISILASKMTDLSKSKCFHPWPMSSQDSTPTTWTPPKAFKSNVVNRVVNPYQKSTTNLTYSLTSSSTMSYIDAATQGRRQIDIPMSLIVKDNSRITPSSTQNTTDTTLTSMQNSASWKEFQATQIAEQEKFKAHYDQQLAAITANLASLETATLTAQTSITNLASEVATKYTEITTNQTKSEERITKALAKQARQQKKEAATAKKMMAQIMKKLGITDDSDSEDNTDDDSHMQHSPTTEHPNHGSCRTNHPKDTNIHHISHRSRNNSRVAAEVN